MFFFSHYLAKDAQLTPFNKSAAASMKKSLEEFAQRQDIPLNTYLTKIKARSAKTVCTTFHKAGLVVPFDRKTTVGYRPLIESDGRFYPEEIYFLAKIQLFSLKSLFFVDQCNAGK